MRIRHLFIVCLLVGFVVFPRVTLGQGTNGVDQRIKELQDKIAELQGQENTLSKQITLLNSQISITTIRIENTKAAITKLITEIDELANEIERLEVLLTKRSILVLRRIPESYKRQVTPQFGVIFLSQNVSDFLLRVKYLTSVQQEDASLLFQLKATQSNFSERKDLREKKKLQQEVLKKQLEQQTAQLEQQKHDKQALLVQTKNSEAVYQQLLAQALAEKLALERALVDAVQVGPIKKGDPIGLVGNSGYPACSSGPHLHFEIRKGGTWVNAEEYLSPREVTDEQNGGARVRVGSGNWDWPLEGDIIVSQHYGKTPYSWQYAYSGGIHTGVDMYNKTSSFIRAPRDGILYSSSQTCGASSIIKIKYIDHGDGTISFYLHVQ